MDRRRVTASASSVGGARELGEHGVGTGTRSGLRSRPRSWSLGGVGKEAEVRPAGKLKGEEGKAHEESPRVGSKAKLCPAAAAAAAAAESKAVPDGALQTEKGEDGVAISWRSKAIRAGE